MPITTKVEGLREPGTYPMMIIEVCRDPSKSGYPMLTLLWKEINGSRGVKEWIAFLPKEHKYHTLAPEKLAKLKMVLGLPQTAKAEDFVGKKGLVTLKMGKENAEGKSYTEVHYVNPYTEAPSAPASSDTQPYAF